MKIYGIKTGTTSFLPSSIITPTYCMYLHRSMVYGMVP